MVKVVGSSGAKAMPGSKPGAGKVFGTAGGKKVQPAGKPFDTAASYKGGHKDTPHMKNC